MEWVDLATPIVAVVATFLAIGLAIQAFRTSRRIRSLEDRLAAGGGAASDASLERLRELQQRMTTSERGAGGRRVPRTRIIVAAALLLAVAAGGAWALIGRGGDSPTPPGQTTAAGTTASTTEAAPPDPTLCRGDTFTGDISLIQVAVYNASGMSGKARENVDPLLKTRGYQVPVLESSPDGRADLARTRVQYVDAADRDAACSVARDLAIRPVRATPLDGITPEQIGNDDVGVVVLVGQDLASR